MIDYSKWKYDDSSNVLNLLIDHQNPRFSHNKEHLSQNELINEMIDKYKIYDLSKSIASDGYFPDKNLVIVKESGKSFVIEGNRRLSALKCLLNPDIIVGKNKDKFVKLAAQVEKSYIKKVSVIIAPSREAANPIVFKEHTGNTAMPWSRIMQAEFYMRQINNGISIEDLEQEYHRSRSEINKFLKLHYMYNVAKSLHYDKPEIQQKVEDKQKFPASVLERVYDSSTMRDFLGISFDNKGNLKGKKDKESFEKAYKKIITDIVEEDVDTRTLNKEDDVKKYSKKIDKLRPRKSGQFTYNDFVKDEEEPSADESPVKRSKKTTRLTAGIIPTGLPFSLKSSSNLQKYYTELKKLPVKSYPNSSAAMLRIFLDKAIRMYLKKSNVKKIEKKENGIKTSIKLADASLGDIIDYLTLRDVHIIDDSNVKKTLKKFKSSKNSSVSLSALNSVTHNEEFSLTEPEVRNIWPNLEGLFRIVLVEPPVKK
jgi:hypothetical protein